MLTHWWLAALPGAAIFVTTLGINLFGDGLRDSRSSPRTAAPGRAWTEGAGAGCGGARGRIESGVAYFSASAPALAHWAS
jgi:hypothetical protein